MEFKDYVAEEMKYYDEFYEELEALLKELTYECDSFDLEYTVAD